MDGPISRRHREERSAFGTCSKHFIDIIDIFDFLAHQYVFRYNRNTAGPADSSTNHEGVGERSFWCE